MPSLIVDFDRIKADVEEPIQTRSRLEVHQTKESNGGTYWSTDFNTPVMARSFFSSTVTVWSVSVLNSEKMSYEEDLLKMHS